METKDQLYREVEVGTDKLIFGECSAGMEETPEASACVGEEAEDIAKSSHHEAIRKIHPQNQRYYPMPLLERKPQSKLE